MLKTYRLHTMVCSVVQEMAKELNRSEGYVIEMAIQQMAINKLPPDFRPGMKSGKEDYYDGP